MFRSQIDNYYSEFPVNNYLEPKNKMHYLANHVFLYEYDWFSTFAKYFSFLIFLKSLTISVNFYQFARRMSILEKML